MKSDAIVGSLSAFFSHVILPGDTNKVGMPSIWGGRHVPVQHTWATVNQNLPQKYGNGSMCQSAVCSLL
jgi:hypothetical protein